MEDFMPDDPIVPQLTQRIEKLDSNYHDLDKRIMSLEIRAKNLFWLGGFLAGFFALSTGTGAFYLLKVRGIQTEVNKAKEDATALGDQIRKEKAQADSLPNQGLLARIVDFIGTLPRDPYWKTGYTSDIKSLTQFATDYANLVSSNTDATTEASYGQLLAAVDMVRERAKRLLKGVVEEKDYPWLADQSFGLFRYILTRLHEDQASGALSDHKTLLCYQSAFPNWLGYVGVLPRQSTDSEQCRKVIRLEK
jgi:hypothetical protein